MDRSIVWSTAQTVVVLNGAGVPLELVISSRAVLLDNACWIARTHRVRRYPYALLSLAFLVGCYQDPPVVLASNEDDGGSGVSMDAGGNEGETTDRPMDETSFPSPGESFCGLSPGEECYDFEPGPEFDLDAFREDANELGLLYVEYLTESQEVLGVAGEQIVRTEVFGAGGNARIIRDFAVERYSEIQFDVYFDPACFSSDLAFEVFSVSTFVNGGSEYVVTLSMGKERVFVTERPLGSAPVTYEPETDEIRGEVQGGQWMRVMIRDGFETIAVFVDGIPMFSDDLQLFDSPGGVREEVSMAFGLFRAPDICKIEIDNILLSN